MSDSIFPRKIEMIAGGASLIEQVDAGVGGHRPVVVFARPVDPGERLLVQQRLETVPGRNPLQRLHQQHLMVARDVTRLEQGRDLILSRRHLVVPGLHRHAQPVQLPLGLGHKGEHPGRNGSEIVVFQLLALGRLGSEERPLAGQQVGPLVEQLAVHQEVFLLRSDGGDDPGDPLVGAEHPENSKRLLGERLD
jgi:hypothetical protein